MSTITKEQLRERARQKVKSLELAVTQSAFADSRAELEEELELARIALASLEAEATGVVRALVTIKGGFIRYETYFVSDLPDGDYELYTAPPAPLSVPDGYRLQPISEYDAMCAAMLQGAERVSNRDELPEGLVACSERMPEDGNSIVFLHPVLCEYCIGEYDTLRKCFKYFELITEDGYSEDQWYFVDGVTHWMPLPAKPNREVL
ncbi:DUF551 domain-containing protein [Enterobacter cloacae]|uniref:DUF551 domain-containing protein n=1 Tax=Enterobacter cloacae TaxID=550 RepID=UPI003F43C2D3